jgi:hypothetical protein
MTEEEMKELLEFDADCQESASVIEPFIQSEVYRLKAKYGDNYNNAEIKLMAVVGGLVAISKLGREFMSAEDFLGAVVKNCHLPESVVVSLAGEIMVSAMGGAHDCDSCKSYDSCTLNEKKPKTQKVAEA